MGEGESFPKRVPDPFVGRSSRHDGDVNCATDRLYGKGAGEGGMTFNATRKSIECGLAWNLQCVGTVVEWDARGLDLWLAVWEGDVCARGRGIAEGP